MNKYKNYQWGLSIAYKNSSPNTTLESFDDSDLRKLPEANPVGIGGNSEVENIQVEEVW